MSARRYFLEVFFCCELHGWSTVSPARAPPCFVLESHKATCVVLFFLFCFFLFGGLGRSARRAVWVIPLPVFFFVSEGANLSLPPPTAR